MISGAPTTQHGFILLPVIFVIIIIAAVSFMINRENIIATSQQEAKLDADNITYLTRSGLQHGVWRSQSTGCGTTSSTFSNTLGNDSYTTTITSNVGTSTSYTVAMDQDGWIDSANTAIVNEIDSLLHVRSEAGSIERPVSRYDLSSIPASSTVLSAVAWFYVESAFTEGPVTVHPVTADWVEDAASWDNLATSMSDTVLATIPAQPASGVWISINMTPLVQAWLNGEPNYGIMLNTSSEGVNGQFASREAASSKQPYMQIVTGNSPATSADISTVGTLTDGTTLTLRRDAVELYQQPDGYAHMRPDATSGKDTYLRANSATNNYGISDEMTAADVLFFGKYVSMLEFPLTQIPAHSKIISAELELYQHHTFSAGGNISVHRITSSWDEGTNNGSSGSGATWNNRDDVDTWTTAGGDYETEAVATVDVAGFTQAWYGWDITGLVQEWVDGSSINRGIALVALDSNTSAVFRTSDYSDTTQHPRLSITYTCNCDAVCLAPQGSGSVLMVTDKAAALLSNADQQKVERMQTWGYSVDIVKDTEIGTTDIDNHDVIYVTANAKDIDIGTQLTNQTNGVVFENDTISDELDIATSAGSPTGNSIDITDTSHPITLPFSTGAHPIRTENAALMTASGSIASGARILADVSGTESLLAVDAGTTLQSGGSATGKRVMLPLTFNNNESWQYVSNNGQLLIQRALEWSKGASCNDGDYTDTFETAAYSNSDGTLSWSGDWTENDPGSAGVADGNVTISGGTLRLDDNPDSGDQPDISRMFNSNGATSTTLRFDYRLGDATDKDSDVALLEISNDGGSTWVTLDDFSSHSGGDSGSLSFDLGIYQSSATQIRFRIASGYASNNEFLEIDNLSIVICGSLSTPAVPIAHWKMDEGGGEWARDDISDHDGKLGNNPGWVSGQLDGALRFDGSESELIVEQVDGLSLTEAITITAWINPGRINGGYDAVLSKRGNYWFGIVNDELAFDFEGSSGWVHNTTSSVNLQTGNWYHIAATFDDANDSVRIYLDGVEVLSATTTSTPLTNNKDLLIGNADSDNEAFRGMLDDVRLYDAVLTQADIALLADASGSGSLDDNSGASDCTVAGNFADDFNTVALDNSTGSLNWSSDWMEIGETDGIDTGDLEIKEDISRYQLEIKDNDGGAVGIMRQLNLSGARKAELSLKRRRNKLEDSDYVALYISTGGTTGPWTELDRYQGAGTDSSYQLESYNLTPYISDTLAIRLLGSPDLGGKDTVWFDDIDIRCSP